MLARIGDFCFSHSGLEEFLAPKKLQRIGQSAFAYCQSLTSAVLNEGLEKLGDRIFKKDSLEKYRNNLGIFRRSGLESVQLPSTLKVLGQFTFYACKSLKNISLPQGLERIERNCFEGGVIEELTLPSTLKEVERDAFQNHHLKVVYVKRDCAVDVRKLVGK